MEIVSFTPGPYPDAVELSPGKYARQKTSGNQKSSSANAGSGKPHTSAAVAQLIAIQKKLDQSSGQANLRRLIISGTGKRRWVREADYKAGLAI